MSTLDLLVYPTDPRGQNYFAFAHAQEHANLAQASADTSTLANYFLDPAIGASVPAGPWNQGHQGAHDNAANALSVQPSLNLIEGSPQDEWWLWTNHWEHLALSGALLAQG